MKKYIGICITSLIMALVGNIVAVHLGITWCYAFAFLWGAITVGLGLSVMEFLDR